jgi:DNA mismatch repair ATPase MutS
MRVFLMYKDTDFDPNEGSPLKAADLTQDLELNTLFGAMAGGDAFLLEVAKKAILTSLHEPDAILYRQHILADCLERADVVREMYSVAVEALAREKKVWGGMFAKYPGGLLSRSIEVLQILVEQIKRLRQITDEHGASFRSEGLMRLFGMLARELNDQYLTTIQDHMRRLKFRRGVLLSAELGKSNKGTHYILRKPHDTKQTWIEWLRSWVEAFRNRSDYVYEIADRDENGLRALSELNDRGVGHVATALAQSTDHILSFFDVLRLELGFYVACLNLRDHLARKGEPICFPEPLAAGKTRFFARKLYDVCLSLTMQDRVVSTDVDGDDRRLVIISGANRGGKSTFLRAVGLSQLMMQCGLFVSAESFAANICDSVFTHFKREEDASMTSGKLDEELSRMSTIVDHIRPGSLVLFNESFASTNEREGSEIARQIVRALLDAGIKVLYVTHMFDLAQGFYLAKMDAALFLRAERLADGQRTFRLVEGEPLPTSYGEDLYKRIFGETGDATSAEVPSQHEYHGATPSRA